MVSRVTAEAGIVEYLELEGTQKVQVQLCSLQD